MLKGRKKKPNFLQYGVLEICLNACLTSCGGSVSSKLWMEEAELEVSSKAAYERVKLRKLGPWLGGAE